MTITYKEYRIRSNRESDAKLQAVRRILEELYPSLMDVGNLLVPGTNPDTQCIEIAIIGNGINGHICNYRMGKGRQYSIQGTGRKICDVFVEVLDRGIGFHPYIIRVGIEHVSLDDFTKRVKNSMGWKNPNDPVQWYSVKNGELLTNGLHIVKVTAVGINFFLAIPYGEGDEEMFSKDGEWKYHE